MKKKFRISFWRGTVRTRLFDDIQIVWNALFRRPVDYTGGNVPTRPVDSMEIYFAAFVRFDNAHKLLIPNHADFALFHRHKFLFRIVRF